MNHPASLLIVVGTVVLLTLVQYLLSRSTDKKSRSTTDKGKQSQRTTEAILLPGLSITGLDERGLTRFCEIIDAGNADEISIFLAFHDCTVPEVDHFLGQTRINITANRPKGSGKINHITLKTIFDNSMLPPSPAGIRFSELSEEERLTILSFEPNDTRRITRDFMARFGGHMFHKNFEEYYKHQKPATLFIPPDDTKRPIFEKLVESGIAEKGRDIPLAHRLALLTLKQLQQMAKDLNLKQALTKKDTAIEALSKIAGARVLFSMQYVADDIFHLKPTNEDDEKIKQEWEYLNAYAKLLLSARKASNSTTNIQPSS